MYIPTRACCYLFREQSTIISTHSMKRAFTHSLARAEKAVSYNTVHEGTDIVLPDFSLLKNECNLQAATMNLYL